MLGVVENGGMMFSASAGFVKYANQSKRMQWEDMISFQAGKSLLTALKAAVTCAI
jgi:hypothetical protein